MIDKVPHELNTIYLYLRLVREACEQLKVPSIPVTFDQALYAKVAHIVYDVYCLF